MDRLSFLGWSRAGPALAASEAEGRLRRRVGLRVLGLETGAAEDRSIEFELMGPGDVSGLLPGAIRKVSPPPGATAAEETMSPYVEFAELDLPWRYSPRARDPATDSWRPWLALLAGPASEVVELPGGKAWVAGRVLEQHPLQRSHQWAHVQQTDSAPPHRTARLLSPCDLKPNTDCVALLVPAFQGGGEPAWEAGANEAVLDVYHIWRFRTGDAGAFKDLALRLRARRGGEPGVAPLGTTFVEYPLEQGANVVVAGSALVAPGAAAAGAEAPPDVAQSLAAMRLPAEDEQGRRVVRLPLYGEAWRPKPLEPEGGWGAQINGSPQHRIAAGLGLWCGVANQDLIARAASERAGGLWIAAQRVAGLAAGLEAAASLWRRRLPATPEARLRLFGPALARVMGRTADGRLTAVLSAVTDADNALGSGRPMPPAFLSSSARRLLRPAAGRWRRAAPGALSSESLVAAANDCARVASASDVPSGRPSVGQLERRLNVDDLFAAAPAMTGARGRLASAGPRMLQSLVQGLWSRVLRILLGRRAAPPPPLPDRGRLDPQVAALRELLPRAVPRASPRRCRPVDLRALDSALLDAFEPGPAGPAAQRVLATLEGLDPDEPLSPPEICADLDLPAWRFLRDEAPEWLLHGRGAIARDEVAALATNPAFVEAFLIGLNSQALGELRWRNIPFRTGCTPIRRFWDRITPDRPGDPARADTDIRGVAGWDPAQPLGHDDHAASPEGLRSLVVALRTDLFRRYPKSLVYLAAARRGASGAVDWTLDADPAERVAPVFNGRIEADLVFFGFPVGPSTLAEHWFVVEEAPPGFRFSAERLRTSTAANGAGAAAAAFADPVRVLLRGDQLLGAAS